MLPYDPARALSFGSVAETYDRARPGYPDAAVDALLAGGPRVLESGAGTGKLTRALIARGAEVTAVEPDAAMAEVLRGHARDAADVRVERLEDHVPAPPNSYDLVVAAQSWHWVDPEQGAAVARAALRDGGRLVAMANRPRPAETPVWEAIRAAYVEHAPALNRMISFADQERREAALTIAPGFTPWERTSHDWTATYAAEAYVTLLSTFSDHILLDDDTRARLLEAVAHAIDDAGDGVLEYPYNTIVVTATPA